MGQSRSVPGLIPSCHPEVQAAYRAGLKGSVKYEGGERQRTKKAQAMASTTTPTTEDEAHPEASSYSYTSFEQEHLLVPSWNMVSPSNSNSNGDEGSSDPNGTLAPQPPAEQQAEETTQNEQTVTVTVPQRHPCSDDDRRYMNDNMTRSSSSSSVLEEDSRLVDAPQGLTEVPVTPEEVPSSADASMPMSMPATSTLDDETDHCLEVVPDDDDESSSSNELQIGDHVYQWRRWMGIPGVFQHHGIVMDIHFLQGDNGKDEERKLTIADFSNVEQQQQQQQQKGSKQQQQQQTIVDTSRRRGGLTQEGIVRTYTDTDQWHKVRYQASFWKRQVYRAGTCTSATSDAVGLVLARVQFIIQHPDTLPDYHVLHANCECVAVWCKTGQWSTLQASSFLELTAAGQVKSSATLAASAAGAQVTVPAAGMWGWLGYTSQVSWLSMHPMVLPALAGYAVVSVGAPAIMYVQARKQWTKTTERLQEAFWEAASEHPEVFAECLVHWSDKK
jgi:hypothetical protein